MAAACALALTAALALPGGDHAAGRVGGPGTAAPAAGPAAQARYASAPGTAGGCTDANAQDSLDPASGTTDGAAVETIKTARPAGRRGGPEQLPVGLPRPGHR